LTPHQNPVLLVVRKIIVGTAKLALNQWVIIPTFLNLLVRIDFVALTVLGQANLKNGIGITKTRDFVSRNLSVSWYLQRMVEIHLQQGMTFLMRATLKYRLVSMMVSIFMIIIVMTAAGVAGQNS